ncbi:hypothetical protein [Paenibacillus rhizoplanae]|uniref:hypothetical protein n=1 Tax=Paenibacillus rhizoplanae TaxID=1917181 RepID=UPI00361EBFCF
MIMFIKYLLFALLVIFMVCAAAYSISSRRSTDPLVQGTKRSIINMLLGGMLVTLSLMSMFMFRGSTLNVVIEAAFCCWACSISSRDCAATATTAGCAAEAEVQPPPIQIDQLPSCSPAGQPWSILKFFRK